MWVKWLSAKWPFTQPPPHHWSYKKEFILEDPAHIIHTWKCISTQFECEFSHRESGINIFSSSVNILSCNHACTYSKNLTYSPKYYWTPISILGLVFLALNCCRAALASKWWDIQWKWHLSLFLLSKSLLKDILMALKN